MLKPHALQAAALKVLEETQQMVVVLTVLVLVLFTTVFSNYIFIHLASLARLTVHCLGCRSAAIAAVSSSAKVRTAVVVVTMVGAASRQTVQYSGEVAPVHWTVQAATLRQTAGSSMG